MKRPPQRGDTANAYYKLLIPWTSDFRIHDETRTVELQDASEEEIVEAVCDAPLLKWSKPSLTKTYLK
ncbi:putative Nudix hydrolase domain-containing protein [Seiridium unicorne]|uniref:Nudix hydrolase domain-containing protein n=1 Tax=Seiridium unicorne TaxID=138068 RepID=A0ABR2UWH6_9PEZI